MHERKILTRYAIPVGEAEFVSFRQSNRLHAFAQLRITCPAEINAQSHTLRF